MIFTAFILLLLKQPQRQMCAYQSIRQYLMAKLIQRAKMLSGKVTNLALIPKNTDSPLVFKISLAFCWSKSSLMISLGSRVVSCMGKALKVCFWGMQDLMAIWNSSSQKVWPVTLQLSQLAKAVESMLDRISSTAKLSLLLLRCSPISFNKADQVFCSMLQGFKEEQDRDNPLLNSGNSLIRPSSIFFHKVVSFKLYLVPETESSSWMLAQQSLWLQITLIVLQQVSAFGEKQSSLMPLVHSQKVILFAVSVITQLCSPLAMVPTQTQAFSPKPSSNEQRRWQWSQTNPD